MYLRNANSIPKNCCCLSPGPKKDSASGPDNVDLRKLIKKDHKGELQANVFNTFLVTRKVPDIAKKYRSIILPKGDTGLDEVNN
jgi:hypothetical protein